MVEVNGRPLTGVVRVEVDADGWAELLRNHPNVATRGGVVLMHGVEIVPSDRTAWRYAEQPTFHTPAAVATQLAVSPLTIRRLIARGDLHAVRVGGQLRISPDALDAYLAQG